MAMPPRLVPKICLKRLFPALFSAILVSPFVLNEHYFGLFIAQILIPDISWAETLFLSYSGFYQNGKGRVDIPK